VLIPINNDHCFLETVLNEPSALSKPTSYYKLGWGSKHMTSSVWKTNHHSKAGKFISSHSYQS